jgi:ABC-2 type transport system permease protein
LNLVSSINLGIFNLIRPFLFISYINSWQLLFAFEPDKILIIKHLLVLLGHIFVFYSITQYYFNKKDILS